MAPTTDRFRGSLLGLAIGDAIGTSVEFKPRGSFPPVTDMVGGGPFSLAPGQWTDDTSQALCLAESLLECGFDHRDQIERYCKWFEEGYLSSTGRCFDIGITTRRALAAYRRTGNPLAGSSDPSSAGNGCIMRLAPVPMFFFPAEKAAIEHAGKSCFTTHGASECVEAAQLLACVLVRAFTGDEKQLVLTAPKKQKFRSANVLAIAKGGYLKKPDGEIRGSGYVVNCLEAALWSFARTETFEDAILMAVNLGEDADTTGAVCGQIAGAFYGERAIPKRWLQRLHMREEIGVLADRLFAANQ